MVREKVGMLRRSLGPLRHRRGGGVSGSGWVSGSPSKNDSEKKEWGQGEQPGRKKVPEKGAVGLPPAMDTTWDLLRTHRQRILALKA